MGSIPTAQAQPQVEEVVVTTRKREENLGIGLTGDEWELVGYIDYLLDDNTIRTGGAGPEFGRQVTEPGFVAGLGLQFDFAPLPDPRVFGIRLSRRS